MQAFSGDSGFDRVLVVVTDGQVSGEDAMLRTIQTAAGGHMPRVFALGIDQAVNAGFCAALASLGGGTCDLVESEARFDEALDGVHRLIGQPVLTDIRLELLDFDGVSESLAPSHVSGLYAGRPLTIFGRHLSESTQVRVRVRSRCGGQAVDDRGRGSAGAGSYALKSLGSREVASWKTALRRKGGTTRRWPTASSKRRCKAACSRVLPPSWP